MPSEEPTLPDASAASQVYALQHFFEILPDLLATATLHGNIWKRVNPSFTRLLGWSPEELIDHAFFDIVHPDDMERSRIAARNLVAGVPLTDFEHRIRCRDGSYRWVVWHAVPNHADNLLYCIGRDITDRRRLDERNEFLASLNVAFRGHADPAGIQDVAVQLLGQHLCAERTIYAEFESDNEPDATVVAREQFRLGGARLVAHHAAARFGEDVAEWRAGRTVRIAAPERGEPGEAQALPTWMAPFGGKARVGIPLMKEGRLVAALAVLDAPPRSWRDDEVALIHEVAERTFAIVERVRAQQRLRETQERYRIIVERARDYAIFTTDAEGRITSWTSGAEAVFGWSPEEAIGQPLDITFTAEDRRAGIPMKERRTALADGQAPDIRWHVRKDGSQVFIEGMMRPLDSNNNATQGFLKIGQDVTAARQLQERQKVLFAELQHRTRNLIGVIRRMADKTATNVASLEAFLPVFRNRLDALSRINGLLSGLGQGERIAFDQMLDAEFEAQGIGREFEEGRITIEGPPGIRLRSATVQIFALALHELTTNAVKYGALSAAEGHLSVTWGIDQPPGETPRLRVEWRESHVPNMPAPGAPPRGGGYGRMLIENALPYQLRANVGYEFAADGVRCSIDLPLS